MLGELLVGLQVGVLLLEGLHLIAQVVHGAGGATIYPTLNNSPTIAKCLSDRIASGKFGMKTGEGFFKWTAETIKAERERYQKALRAGLKIIQKDLPEIK